jgi:alpha-D-ribose 1-methylphosphonate 5-triphosphate synthase subunit PhnG
MDQSEYLSVLCRAPAHEVKQFAEALIPELGLIEVVQNRTGLVMLPMRESVRGNDFFLGEVLVAEAHVRLDNAEGYAACLGRDLQQALAIALIDAAYLSTSADERIAAFVHKHAQLQATADAHLMQQVAATKVEMETF